MYSFIALPSTKWHVALLCVCSVWCNILWGKFPCWGPSAMKIEVLYSLLLCSLTYLILLMSISTWISAVNVYSWSKKFELLSFALRPMSCLLFPLSPRLSNKSRRHSKCHFFFLILNQEKPQRCDLSPRAQRWQSTKPCGRQRLLDCAVPSTSVLWPWASPPGRNSPSGVDTSDVRGSNVCWQMSSWVWK